MLRDIMEGAALLETVPSAGQDDTDWMTQGRCGKHPDPDLWFAPIEEASPRYAHLAEDARKRARKRDRDRAKELCRACPVRALCLRYAVDHTGPMDPSDETANRDGEFGMWGGLDKTERTKLRNLLAEKAEVAA